MTFYSCKTIAKITLTALFLSAAFPAALTAGERPAYTAFSPSSYALTPFTIGPGLQNLSLNDRYATYQWGLKNDGEFQLVQMTTTFRSLDSVYGARKGRSSSISLPDLEPDHAGNPRSAVSRKIESGRFLCDKDGILLCMVPPRRRS